MALLFIDSFDHYTQPQDKYTLGGGSGNITTGRHGKGLKTVNELSIALAPTSPRCIVGGAWLLSDLSGPLYQLRAYGQLNALAVLGVATDGALEISLTGAIGMGGDTWIVVRSEVDVVKLHQWYFIELDITFSLNESGRPIIDLVHVYVDGFRVIDAGPLGTGSDIPGGYPADTVWTTVSHGAIGGCVIDDFYVCDGSGPAPWNAPLGDVQIDVIRPNAVGSSTQWALVGAPTNWGAVRDPVPDDEVTKVIAAAAGLADLYHLDDVNTNNGIIGAQLLISSRRTEEGFAHLTPLLRHAGTTTALRTRAVSPTFFYRNREIFTTMPNGDPLTDANLNALQAGMRREA